MVLFADSSMFDCGMNLENTTDVVFMHKIRHLGKFMQILGRAQRYGRKQPLAVWQLYHENEIMSTLERISR